MVSEEQAMRTSAVYDSSVEHCISVIGTDIGPATQAALTGSGA